MANIVAMLASHSSSGIVNSRKSLRNLMDEGENV